MKMKMLQYEKVIFYWFILFFPQDRWLATELNAKYHALQPCTTDASPLCDTQHLITYLISVYVGPFCQLIRLFEMPFGRNNPICFAIWYFVNLLSMVCFYWKWKKRKREKGVVFFCYKIAKISIRKQTEECAQVFGRSALHSIQDCCICSPVQNSSSFQLCVRESWWSRKESLCFFQLVYKDKLPSKLPEQ